MKRPLVILIIYFLFFSDTSVVIAESELNMQISDFYQKQEKASKILKEIENDLKNGSREKVCVRQREAAIYGIEATESLIKALRTNGSRTEMENLQAGLDKWKELRDFC